MIADCIDDVPAVAPYLALQLDERRDAASLRTCDPPVNGRRRLVRVGHLEDEPQLLLHGVGAAQRAVSGLDHGEPFLLAGSEVLRVLAERVFRVLDVVRSLLRRPAGLLGLLVPVLRLPHPPPLLQRAPPGLDPDRVQRGVGPLDGVERVEASLRVGAVLRARVGYPPRAVARDDLDRRPLLRRQLLEELVDDLLAVALAGPYHRVRLVVHDGGDVAVPLPVARLVDPDLPQAVEALPNVRLEVAPHELHEPPDGLPVDVQPLGHAAPAEAALDHPRRRVGEVQREPRVGLRPRHARRQHAVPGAADPRHPRADHDPDGAEVHAAPGGLAADVVVHGALAPAHGAPPLVALVQAHVYDQRLCAALVLPQVKAGHAGPLDIEQLS